MLNKEAKTGVIETYRRHDADTGSPQVQEQRVDQPLLAAEIPRPLLPDILQPGERCASTSNRNFEGRQGKGGRTHLVSPQMAAAAAIAGHFVDIREWDLGPH